MSASTPRTTCPSPSKTMLVIHKRGDLCKMYVLLARLDPVCNLTYRCAILTAVVALDSSRKSSCMSRTHVLGVGKGCSVPGGSEPSH